MLDTVLTDLAAKQRSKACPREHPGQDILLLHSLLGAGNPQGLLENAHHLLPSACLPLEVAVRPVTERCPKPAGCMTADRRC